jgi:hypothetical protein
MFWVVPRIHPMSSRLVTGYYKNLCSHFCAPRVGPSCFSVRDRHLISCFALHRSNVRCMASHYNCPNVKLTPPFFSELVPVYGL